MGKAGKKKAKGETLNTKLALVIKSGKVRANALCVYARKEGQWAARVMVRTPGLRPSVTAQDSCGSARWPRRALIFPTNVLLRVRNAARLVHSGLQVDPENAQGRQGQARRARQQHPSHQEVGGALCPAPPCLSHGLAIFDCATGGWCCARAGKNFAWAVAQDPLATNPTPSLPSLPPRLLLPVALGSTKREKRPGAARSKCERMLEWRSPSCDYCCRWCDL